MKARFSLSALFWISTLIVLGACRSNAVAEDPAAASTSITRHTGKPMGMSGMPHGHHGRMMMGGYMQRHRLAMRNGLPPAYRGLTNPLRSSPEVLSEGRVIYQTHCVSCHGESGEGDGQAAMGLSPSPANLRFMINTPMISDGYLMWTLSEGGTFLNTAMPAYGQVLSESERWKVIHFLRTL